MNKNKKNAEEEDTTHSSNDLSRLYKEIEEIQKKYSRARKEIAESCGNSPNEKETAEIDKNAANQLKKILGDVKKRHAAFEEKKTKIDVAWEERQKQQERIFKERMKELDAQIKQCHDRIKQHAQNIKQLTTLRDTIFKGAGNDNRIKEIKTKKKNLH